MNDDEKPYNGTAKPVTKQDFLNGTMALFGDGFTFDEDTSGPRTSPEVRKALSKASYAFARGHKPIIKR